MCVPGAQGAASSGVDPRLLQMAQAAMPQGGASTPTHLGPTTPEARAPLTNVIPFKKAKGK